MTELSGKPNGVVLRLSQDLDAPAIARRFVADEASQVPADLVADAELLVSELVTNAVLHGAEAITLRVNVDPPGIGIEVHDRGDQPIEVPPEAPDPSRANGRGLMIVRTLATEWGVTPSDPPPGKTVWFRLEPSANGSLR